MEIDLILPAPTMAVPNHTAEVMIAQMRKSAGLRAQATFLTPAILVGVAITLPPILYTVFTSVHGVSLSLSAFQAVLGSTLFRQALLTTFYVSAISSAVSLILGFIVALHLARQPPRQRAFLMILVLLPLWTSILVKAFAFTIILGREGIINGILSWVFQTKVELPLLFNLVGLLAGMTSFQVPLVVMPILASLLKIDEAIYRAAIIMGAKPARIFWTVTVPLSLPGVFAGLLSIFVLSLGAFIIPALLGGPKDVMLSNLIDFYNRQVLDWPRASAIAVVLLLIASTIAVPTALLRRGKA